MQMVEPTATPSPTSDPTLVGLQPGPGLFRAPKRQTTRAATVLGVLDHVTRGPLAWVVGFGVFALASNLGGRGGVAIAGGYLALLGGYCLLNFWACREAHCVVTGPGFATAGLLGLTAAVWPGTAMSWYSVTVETSVFLAVLAGGFIFERALVGSHGHRTSC